MRDILLVRQTSLQLVREKVISPVARIVAIPCAVVWTAVMVVILLGRWFVTTAVLPVLEAALWLLDWVFVPKKRGSPATPRRAIKTPSKRSRHQQSVTAEWSSSLHSAAAGGQLEAIKFLIERAPTQEPEALKDVLQPALHLAAYFGKMDVVRYLVDERNMDVGASGGFAYGALHDAAAGGRIDVVRYFIEARGMDASVKTSDGQSCLHLAAHMGSLDVVRYLISDQHMDPADPGALGYNALHEACAGGSLEVVRFLISQHHLSPSVYTLDQSNGLHLAAHFGHLNVVRYLVEEVGMDVHEADKDTGCNALHNAATGGQMDVVRYLVEDQHVDTTALTAEKQTALHLAAFRGMTEVAEYLNKVKSSRPSSPRRKWKQQPQQQPQPMQQIH